jgi:predicted kinase
MTSPKLIVFSGLPGSGKSTVAEGLSRALPISIFSVDPIEAAMWRSGLVKAETGIAAYEVAIALADAHLRLGHSVVIDAVNPVEAPRAAWRNLAARYRADLKIIECICADEAIHRRRIEARTRNIPGMPEVTWTRVLERRAEYEAWADQRLVLDTSTNSPEQLLAEAVSYVDSTSRAEE